MTFDLFGGRRLLLAGSRLGGFWVAAGVLALAGRPDERAGVAIPPKPAAGGAPSMGGPGIISISSYWKSRPQGWPRRKFVRCTALVLIQAIMNGPTQDPVTLSS